MVGGADSRLTEGIDVDTAAAGKTFKSVLDDPIMVDGAVVVPRNAVVTLQATGVEQAGKMKGADKITVFEDTDGDGKYDKHKDVITGLNIATAVAPGRGGIWVLNPPYLLFYPDANGDDIPDGDPVVHLSGFGLEDTHSVANSLRWGPDGWLYGAQGSTVTGHMMRPGLDAEPFLHTMGLADDQLKMSAR